MRRKHRELVHVGRDGWLFLIGGTNGVLEQYRRTFARWRLLRGWRKLIEARVARSRALGIRYLHTIVPEKLSVYDDRTRDLDYDPRRSPARALAARLIGNPAFVDLLAPLRAGRDGPMPLYYRTDTHWTYDGCLVGYRTLMRACGAVPPPDLERWERYEVTSVRDLGSKLTDAPMETALHGVIDHNARRVYASPLVEAYEAAGRAIDLHIGAHVRFRNEAPEADPRTVVIFGDSYAHFAPIMLSGLIAETFREVHFIWSSSIDWSYVEAIKPDLLLTEIAERFLVRLPLDTFEIANYQTAEHIASVLAPEPAGEAPAPVPEGVSAGA